MTIAITPTAARDAQREIARVVEMAFPQLGRALAALADAAQARHGMCAASPTTFSN